MQDFCKNIEDFNPNIKHKVLIVFHDMILDMISNKKVSQIVTELFIRAKTNKQTNKKRTLTKLKLMFLSHNLFLQCQKMLNQTVHISFL